MEEEGIDLGEGGIEEEDIKSLGGEEDCPEEEAF